MTLIELIVAITLFIVVVTLAIGGFVAVSRLKTLVMDMKNTQQKARLIYETVYRSAKEANKVTISDNIMILDYTAPVEEKVFVASTTTLDYYSCSTTTGDVSDLATRCTRVEDLLLGTIPGTYNLSQTNTTLPYFVVDNTIPATMTLNMTLRNMRNSMDSPIKLDNEIILENVK